MKHLIIILAAATLAGCATRWNKPGATDGEFYSDRYQCEQEAAANFPVVAVQQMTSPGFQAPPRPVSTTTNCTNLGYGNVSCQSSQQGGVDASIYNRPPTYTMVDANADNRWRAARSCLMAKGYRPG